MAKTISTKYGKKVLYYNHCQNAMMLRCLW